MLTILVLSMAFNIVLIGVIYSFMAESIPESEQLIMQQHARIKEQSLLSNTEVDIYLDEIIAE